MFFLTRPHTSLPNLRQEFSRYGYISNLKINYSKSEAMNITLPEQTLKPVQTSFPFKWEEKALKYLGVWLTPTIPQVYENNFLPLLKAIEKDLSSWHPRNFSCFGRAAICKMSNLPRILYLFRTLPIKIPAFFFSNTYN